MFAAMSATEGHAKPGDVIGGRYRLESWLGQGNMAVVFLATHLATKRSCALKIVHPHLVSRDEVRALFLREAQVGTRIGKNTYIVDVFDAGIDATTDQPFIAMELLQGETLERYVASHGAIAPDLLHTLLLQLGDALEQAHSAGVVHRDLKPGNLFLTYDRKNAPVLKVVDFGIAKVMEEGVQGTATQIGSPAYAAPEQMALSMRPIAEKLGITIAKDISPATDIWALGVLVFELLLGTKPGHLWAGSGRGTIADIVVAVAVHPLPSPTERAGDKAHLLPQGFESWLDRCLRKNAAERWSNISEAVRAFIDLLGQEDETIKLSPKKTAELLSGTQKMGHSVVVPPPIAATTDRMPDIPHKKYEPRVTERLPLVQIPADEPQQLAKSTKRFSNKRLGLFFAAFLFVVSLFAVIFTIQRPASDKSQDRIETKMPEPSQAIIIPPAPTVAEVPPPAPSIVEPTSPSSTPPVEEKLATLNFRSNFPTYVAVNGRNVGRTPLWNIKVVPGLQRIKYKTSHLGTQQISITVKAGDLKTVELWF